MNTEGSNIAMVRGDSKIITLTLTDNQEPFVFSEGDILYFTVKTSEHTEEKTIQKVVTEFPNHIVDISIEPEDTRNLKYGTYVYDIQLTEATGRVTTLVPASHFTLLGEVTYD